MLFGIILFSILICVGSCTGETDNLPAPPGNDPIQHLMDLFNQMSASFNQQIGNLTNDVHSLTQKIEKLERDAGHEQIALTAKLTHSVTLGNLQPLVFDTIVTNIGNGYDVNDGEFIAPVDGTYQFTAVIMGHTGEWIRMALVKNGEFIASLFGGNDNGDTSAQSVILTLISGDKVWLRNQNSGVKQLYGRSNDLYCTFSGFKL